MAAHGRTPPCCFDIEPNGLVNVTLHFFEKCAEFDVLSIPRVKIIMVLIFKKGKTVIHESCLAFSLYSRCELR
jgi:hypothetical protein